jgi:PEP-CTERM motif
MDCPGILRPCGPWIVALLILAASAVGARGEMLVSAVVAQPTPGEFKAASPSRAEPGTTPTTVVFRSLERRVRPEAVRFAEMTEEQRRVFLVLAVVLAGSDTSVVTSTTSTPLPGPGPQTPPDVPPVGGPTGDPSPPVQVPEPGAILLGTLGVGLLGAARWRKSRRDDPSPFETPTAFLAVSP